MANQVMEIGIPTALFAVLSLPAVYKLTNKLPGLKGKLLKPGDCPTNTGIVVHAVLFLVVMFLLHKYYAKTSGY